MNGGKAMIDELEQQIEERELELKGEIKKTSGKCSKILLILAISTYAMAYGPLAVIKIINTFLKGTVHITLGNSKDQITFLFGYLPCVIGDIIAIIIAIFITKVKIKQDIFTRNKESKKFVLLGAVSCIGVGMISSIIFAMYSSILKAKGISIPEPDFSFPTQRIYLILFLIYVCLAGPVLEEIIFRGFILRSMQKYGNLTAIIVSSILFSMFHLNLVQFVNPVLVGILLAFIAIKSESIFPSMIAHIFNNTITFMAAAVTVANIPMLQVIFTYIYALAGIIALTLFVMKYKNGFKEVIKEETIILSTYEKVKASFSGGWSIAYFVFYIIFIVGTILITNIIKILK